MDYEGGQPTLATRVLTHSHISSGHQVIRSFRAIARALMLYGANGRALLAAVQRVQKIKRISRPPKTSGSPASCRNLHSNELKHVDRVQAYASGLSPYIYLTSGFG